MHPSNAGVQRNSIFGHCPIPLELGRSDFLFCLLIVGLSSTKKLSGTEGQNDAICPTEWWEKTGLQVLVLHIMLETASKTFQVLAFHSGFVLDSVRCLSTWFVWRTCIVLKNVLNYNFGMRAVLNWGHFAGSLPLRSLSQCFKVRDCATIILYCPFYAKVSLSFYIPLKSKAILEHLILFNLFTLAA